MMTLADRLNQIIREQNVSMREFMSLLGVSENCIYILTGNSLQSEDKPPAISRALARFNRVEV